MLTDYLRAAMRQARYEILPDDGSYYGEIPACPGVWAAADTLEACRDELQEALEDWLLVGLHERHLIPVIDGIDLNLKQAV
jgi:predicted RNase H-like HicB family nuclease